MSVDNANDSFSKHFGSWQAASRFFEIMPGCAFVQFHPAAQEPIGIQSSEQQVGIRDGRLNSATIADRAWICSRRLRAHFQRATAIEVRDRTSAGPNRVNVEHRNRDGHVHDPEIGAGAYSTVTVY